MVYDTDALILLHRGHPPVIRLAEADTDRRVSVQVAMEFLQAAPDKARQKELKGFLARQGFALTPITEPISLKALELVEQHSLGEGLRAGDAIIAATALEVDMPLCTGNLKHFRPIKGLVLQGIR
jgi:predicted nucleic acid-binding protein